jgi:hypothetical protein
VKAEDLLPYSQESATDPCYEPITAILTYTLVFLFVSRSGKWSVFFGFLIKILVCISNLLHALHKEDTEGVWVWVYLEVYQVWKKKRLQDNCHLNTGHENVISRQR